MEVSDKGGDKFHITPDLRKGTISLFKGSDQLMHFSWKERPSGTVVDVSLWSGCVVGFISLLEVAAGKIGRTVVARNMVN